MATIQTINIGNIVNDGLGDDLRTAFQKVNANFASLNTSLTVTAINLAKTGEPIFAGKDGLTLKFKNLVAGDKITLTGSPDTVVISSTVQNGFSRITTNSGYVDSNDHQLFTIEGDKNIRVTAAGDVITVGTVLDFDSIMSVLDMGTISGSPSTLLQLSIESSNIDFGTFTNPGNLNYDLGTF
jgi:hypothetical protein